MTTIIGFISQKGGVGKSTYCRGLAAEAARSGLVVLIADLDTQQGTTLNWCRRRQSAGIGPRIEAKECRTVDAALELAGTHDLLLIDGPARASTATKTIAQSAHLVVQPSGTSLDDLEPAVLTFHELAHKQKLPPEKLIIALCRTGTDAEIADARSYIQAAGYNVLDGFLPEKPAYRQAQSRGLSVTETHRYPTLKTRAVHAIDALVAKVTDLIQ